MPPKAQKPEISPNLAKSYVARAAREAGINPTLALWIVSHESGFDVNTIGDDGISVGAWQFNLKANPQVSRACALDLKCSTDLALKWLMAGKWNAWSTWRYRCEWYAKENPPNCG